jgi:beta-xylosidase
MNRIPVLLLLSALGLSAAHGAAPQTGTWGDQGNGTYKNPILESNYPDNDVIRVGGTYYMMSSTNHFAPGMTILKSKDLVNWEFSNPIMPAPITFDKNFDNGHDFLKSRGTWAGSFGYNGESYFAYWCHNARDAKPGAPHRIVYAKAKNIEGPWSEPAEITWADGQSINSTDPGVMFDQDTQKAWLACGGGEIYRMSWNGEKLLQNKTEGITVTKTLRGESAKLYKFDGWYYHMNTNAHGPNTREQVFSRAKSMEGPWESRVVLENGNGCDRCPSQGTLLKLDDGSWWFLHQLARGKPEERYNGRPQMLEPVTWKDGWPLIGADTDGNGIGEVVWEHKKPIDGFPVTAPATDDDFSGPALGPQWNWRFNPKMDRWSLAERPGFLRLKACMSPPSRDKESLNGLANMIGQRLMGRHDNVMTAKFDFSGMVNGQEGGLHISAGDHNVIGVRKDGTGTMRLFFKSDAGPGRDFVVLPGGPLDQKDAWLQARVENGLASFWYSLDGKTFKPLGNEVRLLFSGFTPNMVGFYTMHTEEKGHLDVDWFRYDYDGPKGKQQQE